MISRLTTQYNVPTGEAEGQLSVGYEQWITIPINLADVYARVQADRIFNWYGFQERSDASEDSANRAVRMESGGSSNFLRANNMFPYLWRNLRSSNCNDVVNIIIPGLRNIYYNHRGLLPRAEQPLLESVMERPLPQFESIWNYLSLQGYGRMAKSPCGSRSRSFSSVQTNMSEYQLFGSITPYDIVHIPVRHFVDAINRKNPISVQLYPLNVIINIVYSESDLWDIEYQQIIDNINLEHICP